MTTLTVIQARTGSTRLPDKVLKEIGGKPLLQRVIERVQKADIGELVVATSAKANDDTIADVCMFLGVEFYRSSEHDVLNRFYQTAVGYGVDDADDVIVRVTADCPLLCPELLRDVAVMAETHWDYAGVHECPVGFGQEAIVFLALEAAWREAKLPNDREHVVTFIEGDPDRFRLAYVAPDEWMTSRAHWRLTIDEADDLDLIRRLYDATDGELFEMGSREILEAVEQDSDMFALATRQP